MAQRHLTFAVLAALVCVQASAQATLPCPSLASCYADVKAAMPRAGTNAYVQPTQADADAFRAAVGSLIAGEVLDAIARFGALDYDVAYLRDASGATWLVASGRSSVSKGRGLLVVNPKWRRNFAVESPHPLYDTGTGEEAAQIFTALGARLLFIAGTHRCANAAYSPCSGTTGACSSGAAEPNRVSDMAHSTPSFYQAAHQASVDAGMAAMSVHGKASEVPLAEISDGTSAPRDADAPVNRLRAALLANGISTGSCNWQADADLVTLCGTTNVQGRFTNGSPDPCSTAAATAAGKFLHVEQHLSVRREPAGMIAALEAVVPPAPYAPPAITAIVPSSLAAGSPATAITIHGSGFRAGAVARAGTADLVTQVLDASTATATIPASMLAASGTLQIAIANLDTTSTASVGVAVGKPGARRRSAKH